MIDQLPMEQYAVCKSCMVGERYYSNVWMTFRGVNDLQKYAWLLVFVSYLSMLCVVEKYFILNELKAYVVVNNKAF